VTRAAIAAAAAMVAVAACSGSSPPGPPACSQAHGQHHTTASLALRDHDGKITGTYLVTGPGLSGTALKYHVTGTARDGRLNTWWQAGPIVVHATGAYTATTITLDNPGREFDVSRFRRAADCPPV
jgi:hypothetical protein